MIVHSIPRSATLWLLCAVAASLVLHVSHLPLWIWLLAALSAGWRWAVHMGRWSYPSRVLKTAIVLAAIIAIASTFKGRFSLESAGAFLVVATALKLLEMRSLRDGYVVVFMAYFTLATGFLFEQELLAGALGVLAVWLITTALISIHDSGGQRSQARLSLQLLVSSVPIMLVLYFLFPRLGPLWNVALQSDQARTGLASTMAPGDIAQLSQSAELAFRVTFESGKPPARSQLYWRALTLDEYDGRRWQPSGLHQFAAYPPNAWRPAATREGVVRYEVIQEPTDERWLFALRGVGAVDERTGLTSDDRLLYRTKVRQRVRYQAESVPDLSIAKQGLNGDVRRQNLQLPPAMNQRARRWAEEQYDGNAATLVASILRHFAQQNYFYTLRPPVLGDNDVDEFLFDTRRGFCAHYAGATAFLLRSVGIPARVVAGYQGGEWNAEAGYLTVRQFDAHAWVEYWQPGIGWRSIDPTAAVAPERVELGLRDALSVDERGLPGGLLSPFGHGNIGWMNQLRMQVDQINYYWHRFVLSYDRGRQQQLLQRWIGLQSYKEWLYALAVMIAALFALAAAWLWWQQQPRYRDRFSRAWLLLQKAMQRHGVDAVGQTPEQQLQQLAEKIPKRTDQIDQLRQQLYQYLYISDAQPGALRNEVITALNRLRRQLARDKSNRLP